MRARLAKKKAEEEKAKAEEQKVEIPAVEPVKEPVLTPKAEPVEVQPEVIKAEKKEPVKKTDAQKLRRKKG
jgi:hypothetical protein